jgi:hypothetical protein
LGGKRITGTTNDTVYVSNLNVYNIPTLNNSNTEILSRNASNGNVEYTALSAFTYVTGYTYSPTTNTFTIKQNQGQSDITASFNSVSGLTVDGDLTVTGNTSLNAFTGTSAQINGNTTITNGLVRVQGNSSNELVRITQLGSGNALVVEDSTNPDTSPFVIDGSGSVGIGILAPSTNLHVSGNTIISGILSGGTMVITSTPTSGYTTTQILMRNSASGQIEITDSTSPAIYNFGMTYAMSNFNFLT